MDNEDYERINEQLKTLESNEQKLRDQLIKQITINENMIERFNSITQHVNNQQGNLGKFISNLQNKLDNKFNRIEETLHLNQYVNQLIYDIDLLNEHLKDISESIILAKLNIISKHILHPDEIKYIREIFNEQKLKIVSDENIYELIELLAYYNGSNIIFALKIPLFHPETFSFYHLKQLPINNTYLINLSSPYIAINEYMHQYLGKPCPIVENVRYCSGDDLEYNNKDNCVVNIIENREAQCEFIKDNVKQEIALLEPDYIFVMTRVEVAMETTCNPNDKQRPIKGTFLIHFNKCTVNISGIAYSSKSVNFWDSAEITSTLYNRINYTSIVEKLDLETINDKTIQNLDAVNLHNTKTLRSNQYILSLSLLVGAIIVIYGIRRYIKTPRAQQNHENYQMPVVIHTAGHLPQTLSGPSLMWPSLHSRRLEEGGVTYQ